MSERVLSSKAFLGKHEHETSQSVSAVRWPDISDEP
jgi:hypothetical protein